MEQWREIAALAASIAIKTIPMVPSIEDLPFPPIEPGTGFAKAGTFPRSEPGTMLSREWRH